MAKSFSKIQESVGAWNQVRELLRSGEGGNLVPVVIPRDRRGFAPLFWAGAAIYCLFAGLTGVFQAETGTALISVPMFIGFFAFIVLAGISLLRNLIVEVEEGTTGILSSWGKIVATLPPGRRYIWKPWEQVEYIVDTSTEIPYSAPVLSSPTQENVPLKSIEFFLKFKIENPVKFVRNIGASNFDIVLSSAVQDAIRQRSRTIRTADAYNLRGSDVGDMQKLLNQTMRQQYGVMITGANIPDVQLPEQYQNNLSTKERVAKERDSYEKEFDLMRKRRKDSLELSIEQTKKDRDAKLVAVREAVNRARQDVALMLQETEAEAEKIRLNIEAKGKSELKSAENQARALQRLGEAYKDNQAVLQYELEMERLEVAQELIKQAPRPVVVKTSGEGSDNSPLTTLMLAQMLPNMMKSVGE